jgi:non-ribosomal peptide synthetase-like protein
MSAAVSDTLRRADLAPPARTLVDVFEATVAAHGSETAIDDTAEVLTYEELSQRSQAFAARLRRLGIGRAAHVGVRLSSGTNDLYVAILGVLHAGAAYVPVDADDPAERAALVFGEAQVAAVVVDGLQLTDATGALLPEPTDGAPDASGAGTAPAEAPGLDLPSLDDTAWIIFTSGSTGTPKGVAVSHRSAAAFVDAEARWFLQDEPLGPGDRVLAGLSVAFDASCEEIWLAWRHGACLVPAPRSLVRSGMDLGPWITNHEITVVSTVPTLAGLWPADALDDVRLLIFGGEACPPALAERVCTPGREVWNTYGPTEATVVSCGAVLGGEPVRIGLPLDGWDLAVVDEHDQPVAVGETGELIIGGVGLARYLDPTMDATKFAPMESLGWQRAYRSGDLVINDPEGLRFVGRADDQVKLNGRRIELGEVDAALLHLDGVDAAAAAVQTTPAGIGVLVGYLAGGDIDLQHCLGQLRESLPAALVPLLTIVEEIPVRISGKVDRAALPWPIQSATGADRSGLDGELGDLAARWQEILGLAPDGPDADFFALGGGSLTAARLVSVLREDVSQLTVADVYGFPTLRAMSQRLEELRSVGQAQGRSWVRRTPRVTQWLLVVLTLLVQTITGLRWLTWALTLSNLLHNDGLAWAPRTSWGWILGGWLLLVTPFGRMSIAALGARLLLIGVGPGTYPRGGSAHLRIWAAEQLAESAGATNLAGAPWISYYARALGAEIGRGAEIHTLPPVTGLLRIGPGASIEPEVDLAGYWLDGDELRVGRIGIGRDARVGSRSTILPGSSIGRGAEIRAGSMVSGKVPAGQRWAGSPARHVGRAKSRFPEDRPPRNAHWVPAFGLASGAMSLLPLGAAFLAALVIRHVISYADGIGTAILRSFLAVPLATLVGFTALAATTGLIVRLLGIGMKEGTVAVRSRLGWQAWCTERLLDMARTVLFPLYASLFTPTWLRLLGAKVGAGVEASTTLLIPKMTTIEDGAFLADDTMVAGYELGGGWLRIDRVTIGRRAFLGNSGMAAGGRSVPRHGLVAVLSAAPKKSKAGTSWLGNPPVKLRRVSVDAEDDRTFAPPRRLKVIRGAVELCRFFAVATTVAIVVGILAALLALTTRFGMHWAALLSGGVMLLAGLVAALTTTAAKWLVVGPIREGNHPLWSSFVWRNEVVDAFVEMVAAPWFANAAAGTPVLSIWLRSLGASIGRGVWCESYWLPEADLVRLGDGVSVNRGCVLQTHLFHDRVMSCGTVDLDHGATMGPHGVILPGASIGADATVGPASLVMRGEHVPARTRWAGNPIVPWPDEVEGEWARILDDGDDQT